MERRLMTTRDEHDAYFRLTSTTEFVSRFMA